jgi:hypothetical protein
VSKPIDQALRYPAARGQTMNVGVSIPLPAYLVDPAFMARTAEDLGFESFWCAPRAVGF